MKSLSRDLEGFTQVGPLYELCIDAMIKTLPSTEIQNCPLPKSIKIDVEEFIKDKNNLIANSTALSNVRNEMKIISSQSRKAANDLRNVMIRHTLSSTAHIEFEHMMHTLLNFSSGRRRSIKRMDRVLNIYKKFSKFVQWNRIKLNLENEVLKDFVSLALEQKYLCQRELSLRKHQIEHLKEDYLPK